MDIERPTSPSGRFVLKDFLAKELQHYADALAAGRWNKNTIRYVANSRTLVEELGREEIGDAGDDELAPIVNTVELMFEAHKEPFPTDDGDDYEVANYTLESRVSQDIVASEIPEDVLQEVIHEACYDDAHPLWKSASLEYGEDGVMNEEAARDALYGVDIARSQVLSYELDYLGRVRNCTTSYRYLIEDEVVHELSHELADHGLSWEPVHRGGGYLANEAKPIGLSALTEEGIISAVKDIELKIDAFLTREEAEDIAADAELPHREHVKRALGMLGLISGKSYRKKR